MSRDHLLGWPAALLALDPEPRKIQRTLTSPRMTPEEEAKRRADDVQLTKALERQGVSVPPPTASEPKFVPQYFRGDSGTLYRDIDGPETARAQKFDKRTKAWIKCVSVTNETLHSSSTDIKLTTRPPEIPE